MTAPAIGIDLGTSSLVSVFSNMERLKLSPMTMETGLLRVALRSMKLRGSLETPPKASLL